MEIIKKKKHLSKRKKEKLREIKKEEKILKKEQRKNKESKYSLKPLFGGIAVGIANIIPGVSGGTMLVIFDLFEKLTNSINDIFKKNTDTRKQSIIFVLKVLIGIAIGLVGFAKILGYTLNHMEAETIFFFVGLILFSVPIIIRNEMKNQKFNIIFFLIGILLIVILEYLNIKGITGKAGSVIGIIHYITLIGLGIIGGASMILPGISGSMVMLVLGKYEMVRGYIDKITSLDINIYIKLAVFAIGVLLGIVLSAKILSSLLKKHKGNTISLILGFVIASALILPLNLETPIKFTTEKTCGLLVSFILGGIIIFYLDKLEKKNSDK